MSGKTRRRIVGSVAGLLVALGAAFVVLPGTGQGAPVAWSSGDVIVADSLDKEVEAVDPKTGAKTPISTGGNFVFPAGIAFDGDGNLIVVDRDAFANEDGGVIRVDQTTGLQTIISNNAISDTAGGEERFADPIAIDVKGNNAYVTDFGGKPSRVVKVNLTTGKQSLLSGGKNIADPLGIDTGLTKALVADAGGKKGDLRLSGGLIQVDLGSGKQKVIAGKGDFPDIEDLGDVDSESKHSALVIDSGAFNFKGAMFRVDLDKGKAKTIFKSSGVIPAGLAAADKQTAYVTRVFPAELYEVDLKSGDLTLLNGSGFNNPLGLGIAP